jgi:hypothetical protein
MSITRIEEMLKKQLGGEWHSREKVAGQPFTRDKNNMPVDLLEHTDYFWTRLKSNYALELSKQLGDLGIRVEGLSGDAYHIPNGQTELRIKKEDIPAIKTIATSYTDKTIRWAVEEALGLPHGDRSVA